MSSPYQPYFDKKTIMEVVLGRVENFSTHDAVYHLPQAILLGSNRYFFSCCPYDFCICHENTSDDRILRLSRLWFMLSELTVDLENTTFRFIDLGRTHSSDTRAVVEAASRQALGDSLDEALCDSLGRATDSDDPEDDPPHLIIEQRLTEIFRRVSLELSGVGSPCEICEGLHFTKTTVRLVRLIQSHARSRIWSASWATNSVVGLTTDVALRFVRGIRAVARERLPRFLAMQSLR